MQVNCLVFPSPQKFDIQPIINKIVLIPQEVDTDNKSSTHIGYQHYMNLISHDDNDEFEKTIRRLNIECLRKTRDQSKIIKTKNNDIAQGYKHINIKKDQKIYKQNTLSTRGSQKQSLFPSTTYHFRESKQPSLIQTNLLEHKVSSNEFIPCLFLPGKKDKIVVFFHANAQDITSSSQFLKMINYETQYSILAMEYRGYSINNGQTNPQMINNDAQKVIKYLLNRNISPDQIVVFGRSIGCAIALGLVSAQYRFYAMVLLSPFLSLKKIARELYGNCAGWALKEGFDNEKNTLQISCPLLLIHGMKDTLVPYEHSLALFSHCKSYCQLKLIENMTHSKFNFKFDFIKHFQSFIYELNEQSTD